jgi:hypothetical protein
VNTDADDQYVAEDIGLLVGPILDGRADLVVGERSFAAFGPAKRWLQRLGTWMVRVMSGTDIRDAASGFRAISREAACSMKVFNDFSYTVETLIQAGLAGWAVESVPVRTNPTTRPSRLFRSNLGYIRRQVVTMLRIVMAYRAFQFFAVPGALLVGAGFLVGLRFLWFYAFEGGVGHVQSLIFAALAMGLGAGLVLAGFLADLVSVNRKLLQSVEAKLHALSRTVPSLESSRDARPARSSRVGLGR